jgi:2-iminoacetate synthase ThiH
MRAAHRLGITSTATVLFGHVEDEIHLCEHLEILRILQKDTGGFAAIEPVPFIPGGTVLAREKNLKKTPSMEHILRVYAVIRIFSARWVKYLQADWTKLGLESTLRTLAVGANDIASLSCDPYEIRSPAVNGRLMLPTTTLRPALAKAGKTPQERDPFTMRAVQQALRPKREELVLV